MNKAIKVTLQVSFLIGLIFLLAALMGVGKGYSASGPNWRATIGPQKRRKRRGCNKGGVWSYSGMQGEYAATVGGVMPMVGVPQSLTA